MGVDILEQGEGILWLLLSWKPSAADLPGRRLKLHPDDLYAFGVQRGLSKPVGYPPPRLLTVFPRRSVKGKGAAPYGCVAIQGHGRMDCWPLENPSIIRFGQPAQDEYFVSCPAVACGVTIKNLNTTEPLVM